jgi:cell wall-associated NlpC family hydrolase
VRKPPLRPGGRAAAIAALGLAAGAVIAISVLPASGEPAAISSKRAEVAALESQVSQLDSQLEMATEAYNGARYRLGEVRASITVNVKALTRTNESLGVARVRLAQRLKDIYRRGPTSFVDVLLASGGISEAANSLQDLRRVSEADKQAMVSVRDLRGRQVDQRQALLTARKIAGQQVVAAHKAKTLVNGLLQQRAALLQNARGDLVRMIEAQRRAEIAAAMAARARAIAAQQAQAQAAAQAAAANGGGTTAAGATAGGTNGNVTTSGILPVSGGTLASGAAPEGTPGATGGSGNAAAVGIAEQYLGTPYKWGGASPGGFDCSGLASYVYGKLGKDVPHYTGAIYSKYQKVPESDLEPGDLVFFNGGGHMGIYAGNGEYIHAPHTGDVVKMSSLTGRSDYVGAVRP